ncbi:serine hydrolase domain-containing protein [Singulisphaera rosea]
MRIKWVVVMVWACFQATTARCQTPVATQKQYDFTQVEVMIRQALAKREIPSMVVALSWEGRIVYERAFGYADLEGKVPATVDTAYRLASVSKPITATGLMVLHQKGLVKLDEPAEQYAKPLGFRSFAGNPSDVTLRHLLNHSSGLSSYFQYAFGDREASVSGFEAAFHRYGTLFHPVGRMMEYSNLGYGLIDFIIAKQSGKSFASFMKQEVFDPLQMTNSFVSTPENPVVQVAKIYDGDLKRLPAVHYNLAGAGNVYSSAHDLMLFSSLHLSPDQVRAPVLSKENTELMRSNAGSARFHPYFGPSTSYALGWYVQSDDGGYHSMWHEGGMPGASTFLKLIPSEKLAVTALTNVADKNQLIDRVANELIKVVLPSYRPEPLDVTANYKPYEAQADYLGKWKGIIHVQDLEIPCTLTFKPMGNVHIAYGKSDSAKLKEATFRGIVNGKSFIGGFLGDLPSDDIQREPPPILTLHLIREGQVLSGRIGAYTAGKSQIHHLYPFYIRLERDGSQ